MLYFLAGILLLPYYRYQINPDGISYISIAEKYLRGEFGNAINGYWGPMISWLMVPFLAVGIDSLVTAKIVSLLAGLAALFGIWLLSFRFAMNNRVRIWMMLIMVPLILTFAVMTITPDVLVLCVLAFYLYYVFNTEYLEKPSNGILCGTFGGLAYLCKSFAFPFFLIHFLIFNTIHYLGSSSKENRKALLRNYFLGMAVFAVICSIWISAISIKYGKLMFGTSGSFVHALSASNYKDNPVHKWGFLEPSNPTAISSWEDPTYFWMKDWNPFGSWESLQQQVQIIINNLATKPIVNPPFFPFFLPTVLVSILFFLPLNRAAFKSPVFYSLLSIGIYCGLYSIVYTTMRFLLIVYVLAILLGGQMLNHLVKSQYLSNYRKNIALTLFLVLYIAMPVKYLFEHTYYMKWVHDIAEQLKVSIPANSRIASNINWDRSLYIIFQLNSFYQGRARTDVTEEQLKGDLERFNIEYYIEWGKKPDFEFLLNYEDVTGGVIPELKVFRIKTRHE
jgi:hypothetical protein